MAMKKKSAVFVMSLAALVVIGLTTCVSEGPPGAAKGFNARTMIGELSLLLPAEMVTRAMTGLEGAVPGKRLYAGGPQPTQIEFTRDEKLFLTADEIGKLLPIMTALKENPIPSASKARKVQADVDGVLTDEQKAEIKDYREAMQKQTKNMAQQGPGEAGGFGAGPGQQHGQPPAGGPPFGGQGGFGGPRGFGGPPSRGEAGGQSASKQRLQKELDAFIAILQERQKQIGS